MMSYVFCLDCNQIVDAWKYDDWKRDHGDHKTRQLTEKELSEAIAECMEHGCLD